MGEVAYFAAFFRFLGLAFLTRGSGGVFRSVRSTSSGLGGFAFMGASCEQDYSNRSNAGNDCGWN